MSKMKWTGLILGLIGFTLPLIITFPGLSLAGHFAMSIFLLAAVFWMFETVPIYSTSILVIFFQVILLSAEGVKRSQKAFEQADLVVYLKDLSKPMDSTERSEIAGFQKRADTTPFLLIGTKLDLQKQSEDERLLYDLKISALEGENISTLKKLMKQRALENKDYDTSSLLVTSTRHRDALQKARENVTRAISALDQGLTGDFLSIDLRTALKELGTITGEITNEDILSSIFSRFCIGK